MNQPAHRSPKPWLHRFACLLAASTFLLIVAGASVTSNRAGLSVPDWPTSYGYPLLQFPVAKMVGGIFYEHGHRLIASTVGLLTLILAVWLLRAEPRRGVRYLGLAALAAVLLQGILGGLTVKLFLPPSVSVAHAGLAEAFFCLTIAVALVTSPRWSAPPSEVPYAPWLQRFALATTIAVYLQLLLGATVRHAERALFIHILGAIVVLGCAWTAGIAVYTGTRRKDFAVLGAGLGLLVFAQIWVGIITWAVRVPKAEGGVLMPAQIWWPTAHLAIGALILAVSFILTLKSQRLLRLPVPAPQRSALAAEQPFAPGTGPVYLELIKPRIVSMVAVTTLLGFFLGAQGLHPLGTLLLTLVGVSLGTAGAAVLNNYLERDVDGQMTRTRERALPTGRVSPENALAYGITLSLAGLFVLVVGVNLLTGFLVLLASFLYVVVYTPMKRLTWLNTSFGAIPGAIPPLCGWAAATGQLDLGAWVLFAILFAWQHPHFFAIAWMFRDDYSRAGFKMLPVVEPSGARLFRQTWLFLGLLLVVSVMPTAIGMAGRVYGIGALVLGAGLLVTVANFARAKTFLDARRLLKASVLYLPLLLLLIFIDAGF